MSGSGRYLVVVESPAKAKTISRFLGPKYQVEASYGHVRDLPQNAKEIPAAVRGKEWARLGVDIDGDFAPVYVIPADKKKYVRQLKDALKGADGLLLATDEDREGESISWHVLQLLKPKESVDVRRIVFHEVTPEAVRQALESPRSVDENLVRAQEARRILDRLYGYSLSPLLWKRVAPGLSAGRVQSVAVRLLVERERERISFVSSEYWDLTTELASASPQGSGRFKARLQLVGGLRVAGSKSFDPASGELKGSARLHLLRARARTLAEGARVARPWRVSTLERTPGTQRPAPPFITSTLQQEANRKLRMTSRRTMQVAQRLYEGVDLDGERVGLITYMRTDSVNLAERAVRQARKVIAEIYGADFLPEKPVHYKTSAKRAQEAHEAIRPTDLARRPQDVRRFLDDDEHRLYELIWQRTIACQMLAARFERTSVEVTVAVDGEELVFAASGRRIVFPGFLRAYVEGSDDPEGELGDQETLLPALEKGQELEAVTVEAEGHTTKAPYRYTEASLVKKLEEEGIGRPSTYASIISTIQERDYVFKKGNELVPTFTAFCVTELLEKQFRDLVEVHFTARMEDDLDEIAAGKIAWSALVADFYRGHDDVPGLVERVENGEVTYPAIPLGTDPDSGEDIVVKVGKYGPYIRRDQNFATIPNGMAPDELDLERALELLRHKNDEMPPVAVDPVTGRPITLKVGRFGEYLELGSTDEERERKVKPKRVSLPRGLSAKDVTSAIAERLIQLPRTLGRHPESGEEVTTGIGRFGPFVKLGDDFRNLDSWQKACDLELADALEILKQPKRGRGRRGAAAPKTVLREIGEVAGAAGPVKVIDGRYGPYVTDGKVNASLPKGSDPGSLTAAAAAELLAAAAERKKTRRGRGK